MSTFERLFGLSEKDIKEDVIITPFLSPGYFTRKQDSKRSKGFLFEVITERNFSVVKTGINSAFVGDSVVYLKDTPGKRFYFIGSCGVVSNFNIGDLIVVGKALAWEGFSQVLNRKTPNSFISLENGLSRDFSRLNKDIQIGNLASLGSLSLQGEVAQALREKEIDIVDMEASSFLSAVEYFKMQGLALLYATDIIDNKPFFRNLDKKERLTIKSSRQRAISSICDFIQKQNA